MASGTVARKVAMKVVRMVHLTALQLAGTTVGLTVRKSVELTVALTAAVWALMSVAWMAA